LQQLASRSTFSIQRINTSENPTFHSCKPLATMNLSLTISLIFVLTLIASCTHNTELGNVDSPELKPEFELPKLKGDSGNGEHIDTARQIPSKSYVLKSTSTTETTIHLFDLKHYDDSPRLIPDSLPFSLTNKVELLVDNTQGFTIKFRDSYLPPPPGTDEFGNVVPEYHPPYDSVKVIPAYIVNFTDSIQGIESHDGKIIMIQEALNSNNEWKPIEYFSYSGCGNSYGITSLDTNCYLMFGVNKYKGDVKTKLRVRLRTNGNTILSNEYFGYINKSQFKQEEGGYMHRNYLKDDY